VTSREHSYHGELAEFTHLSLEPFTLDRIGHWYLLSTGTEPTDAVRARVFAALLRDDNLRDLFGNPLMLTIVTAADVRNWVTDGEKAPLLRRCVEMLTEDWDSARGVTRWSPGTITPRQMKTSLADLSCTLTLQNRSQFTIRDFELLVESNVGIHDSPAELLNACHATGLITAEDRGTYRFAHQSLREYLAASRVADHVSVARPLLRACPRNRHAQNVWSLSCATTTDASDLLGTALRLEGQQGLERATILAWALGQQITASRDVINKCSDYIATQLETELADALIASTKREDHADSAKAAVWRGGLRMPAEGRGKERDQILEHLLVAVHNTRSGSGAEMVSNRLVGSSVPAVRFLATLQTVDGDCTVRIQRGMQDIQIFLTVLDPARLLAAELSAAHRLPISRVADSHSQGYAFISYVWEDSGEVEALQRTLEAAGIRVWRDSVELRPGDNWRAKIRHAVNGAVFIACFSRHSVARKNSYQNEEILLAIDELRRQQADPSRLIPVRFDDCDIPDLKVSADQTLASIESVDLFGADRDSAARQLVEKVELVLR
jgi:hypothetical protein